MRNLGSKTVENMELTRVKYLWIANAKREVEESLIKSLEQNLKENLAKDTIERMNIPEVLKKLSNIGAKQVTGTSLPE